MSTDGRHLADELQLGAGIVVEMVTAGGIVALGAMLYTVLGRRGENVARVPLWPCHVEATLLAVPRRGEQP